jgi:TPR repeat protein
MRRIATLVFLFSLVSLTARAEEIDACDRLAANPEDPQKVGSGVPFFEIDGPAALEACRAALEGHPHILRFRYQLALALARTKQFAEAAAAIKPAAEAGYAAAEADLGYLLRDGLGVDLDAVAALRWSMLAAQQGYSPAMNDVGFSYANGLGVDVDFEQALIWYRRAVALGDRYAQKHLGDMYKNGRGVEQSDSEAVRLYRQSAEQGYRGGETALGLMLLAGRGAPMDRAGAIELFKRAAAQEEPEAIAQLQRLSAK